MRRRHLLGDADQGKDSAQRAGRCAAQCPERNAHDRPIPNEARGASRKKIFRRCPGFPLDRFSVVERNWSGGRVVIVGGGTSLTNEQCEIVEAARAAGECFVIAVNDVYLRLPNANVCYFADAQWWGWHNAGIDKPKLNLSAAEVRERFAAFAGEKCTIQQSGGTIEDVAVHMMRNATFPNLRDGLSINPEALYTGATSANQATNIGTLAGGRVGILLGIDGHGGHWHGNHPIKDDPLVHGALIRAFRASAKGVASAGMRMVNCSPGSAIDCFERMDLKEALTL